jgi:hypothetical protein
MKRIQTQLMVIVAALLVAALPLRLSAQASQLAASEATAFLGVWELGLDSPQGAVTVEVTLKDQGGKVAASVSMAPIVPEPLNVTDVTKEGTNLVLKYTLDFQGQAIPAKVSLVPDGAGYKASFDFAEGQFVMDGTAKKK